MLDRTMTVVSNRLPVRLEPCSSGGWSLRPSDGGLVGALEPVLRERGGAWVGWAGSAGAPEGAALAELGRHGRARGFDLLPVGLSAGERDAFYEGACNEALWPLLHGLPERSRVRSGHAGVYGAVNRRFADTVASGAAGETVWVHDYHLLQMGEPLRRRLPRARLGFFFHTPFPEPEMIHRLPWGAGLLPSLASFHLIGFQTERDRENFHAWVGTVLGSRPERSLPTEAELHARTGVFPISVDWEAFHRGAAAPAVIARAREIRRQTGERHILLGVDRLDYTKGIPERLRAYERLLERHEALRGRVVFAQLAVPSRTTIAEYARTRLAVEDLVARVNRSFGFADWTPIRYVYGTWDRAELLAWYVAADVAVVTPVRDGMNLVAKEFAAASRGEGVLVLSPGAGASEELGARTRGALLADPHDPEGLAATLHAALRMPRAERRARLARLQGHLERNDVHRWAASFLERLGGSGGWRRPGSRVFGPRFGAAGQAAQAGREARATRARSAGP